MSLSDAARPQLEAAVEVVRLHIVEGYAIADAARATRITRAKARSALRFVHRHITSTLRTETPETLSRDSGR